MPARRSSTSNFESCDADTSAAQNGCNDMLATAVLAMLLATVGSFAGMAWATPKAGAWLRDPLYADKESRFFERVASKGQAVTVAMFGSSRTSNALRGTDLEAILELSLGRPVVAFNFGVPSSGPITQTLYLKRLLATGMRPDLVLFEIMPPLLAGQMPDPIESHFFAPNGSCPAKSSTSSRTATQPTSSARASTSPIGRRSTACGCRCSAGTFRVGRRGTCASTAAEIATRPAGCGPCSIQSRQSNTSAASIGRGRSTPPSCRRYDSTARPRIPSEKRSQYAVR